MSTARIHVETHQEAYPVVGIRRADDPDEHEYGVPEELLAAYEAAEQALARLEEQVLTAAGFQRDEYAEWKRPRCRDRA